MSLEFILYASFLFFLSELILMMAKRSRRSKTKMKKDRNSLLLLWITLPLSLSSGFFLAKYGEWNTINKTLAIIGLSFFILGMMIRWISIVQLKKEFTVDVSVSKNHLLKTNGMYSSLRHPSYLGLWLICLGLALGMNNLISLALVAIPVSLVLVYRIRVEEDILIREFGERYLDYRKRLYQKSLLTKFQGCLFVTCFITS